MEDFWYSHTIDSDDPIVRAAFRVAQKAHVGELRGKASHVTVDGEPVQYISHPIVAYHLLIARGVTDPIVLAATLLHDGLEQGAYKERAALMRHALVEELGREGLNLREADDTARKITALVGQVTDHEFGTSKRVSQVRRARDMSFDARIVKIADQTANLICNLMAPNDERFSARKTRRFAYKAFDLVENIYRTGSHHEKSMIKPWRDLFREIWDWNHYLLHTPNRQEHIRHDFRGELTALMRGEETKLTLAPTTPERPTEDELHSIFFEKSHITPEEIEAFHDGEGFGLPAHGGIARVDVNPQGLVVGFLMWEAPHTSPAHVRNRMQAAFVEWLERHGHHVRTDAELQEIILQNGERAMEGCYHHVEPPMNFRDFADRAFYMDCMGAADRQEFLRRAQDIVVDFAFLTPGFR